MIFQKDFINNFLYSILDKVMFKISINKVFDEY